MLFGKGVRAPVERLVLSGSYMICCAVCGDTVDMLCEKLPTRSSAVGTEATSVAASNIR